MKSVIIKAHTTIRLSLDSSTKLGKKVCHKVIDYNDLFWLYRLFTLESLCQSLGENLELCMNLFCCCTGHPVNVSLSIFAFLTIKL